MLPPLNQPFHRVLPPFLSVLHPPPHICPFIRINVESSLSLESTAICSHIYVSTRGSLIIVSPDDVIYLKAKCAAIFNKKIVILHLNSETNGRQHHTAAA